MESVRQSVNADAAQNATIVSDTISYAGATGKGTTIAIPDSGIDREHDDFGTMIKAADERFRG